MKKTSSKDKNLKLYNFNQSPFYKLKGLQKFGMLLGIDTDYIGRLFGSENYYIKKRENGRETQTPIRWLKQVHKRIDSLLSRIETPNYLHSNKGKSYQTNAHQHCLYSHTIKTDISKYFPSTSREQVYQFFLNDFKCAADIAGYLADICCYKQEYLPIGSHLSARLAFFVSKKMFDEIYLLAIENECLMTVYVDDISISGEKIKREFLWEIRKIIHKHGYKTKNSKSKCYLGTKYREITGVGIREGKLVLPNRRHKMKAEIKKLLTLSENEHDIKKLRMKYTGRRLEQRQIEERSSAIFLGNTSS